MCAHRWLLQVTLSASAAGTVAGLHQGLVTVTVLSAEYEALPRLPQLRGTLHLHLALTLQYPYTLREYGPRTVSASVPCPEPPPPVVPARTRVP